jgi:hypothetical protein
MTSFLFSTGTGVQHTKLPLSKPSILKKERKFGKIATFLM